MSAARCAAGPSDPPRFASQSRMLAGNPIFIGGVPRSGTTLLRVILDTHPRIFCGTELRAVNALASLWSSAEVHSGRTLAEAYALPAEAVRDIFVELILSFLRPAWTASGKPRVAEKTPSNISVFPELRRLFPHSPLVHVLRDVRDVVASRLERDRVSAGTSFDALATAGLRAREWAETMGIRRRMLAVPDLNCAYHEIRYEDLVGNPEGTLVSLFDFIGERFDPAVLAFHRVSRNVSGTEEWSAEGVQRSIFTSSVGRWRTALTPAELHAIVQEAGEVSREVGYDLSGTFDEHISDIGGR